MAKKLISRIVLHQGQAVRDLSSDEPFGSGDAVALAGELARGGADAILIFDRSEGDAEHDRSLDIIRQITRTTDIPVYGAGNIKRPEDVKKILYAGCKKAVLNYAKETNLAMLEEVSARFGKEKIAVCIDLRRDNVIDQETGELIRRCAGEVILMTDFLLWRQAGADCAALGDMPRIFLVDGEKMLTGDEREEILGEETVSGLAEEILRDPKSPILSMKEDLAAKGLQMEVPESTISWADLKLGSDGLVPVVVQDARSDEVLMVAWMNEEAFDHTVRTGRMTYYSRSRQELWVKGDTSGHYQYVRELKIDCDQDTILARVIQIGAACHTGNRSCFYRTFLERGPKEKNPMQVFEEVYGVIQDRRVHPKEGSYTNYLFDKGLDKILKKIGEEAAETVIAAKNPDPEEVRYEIADLLYHLMVLMVEKGVSWEAVCEELANR